MTEKEMNRLELLAWSNDNFKSFKKAMKKFNVKVDKEAVIEEFVRGKFKPSYKRLDLVKGKKFVGCIFAPLTFNAQEIVYVHSFTHWLCW